MVRRQTLRAAAIATALLTLARPLHSQGADQGIEWFSNYWLDGQSGPATFGWSFTAMQPMMVTHLGLWDKDGDGLAFAHEVAVWSPSRTLLASATLPAGTTAASSPAPRGLWRWVQLSSPVLLTPGQDYRIGAYYPYGAVRDRFAGGYSTVIVTGPGVIYFRGCASSKVGSELQFPDLLLGEPLLGPNFRYFLVPEPALLQVPFLIGLSGVAVWLRRRKSG